MNRKNSFIMYCDSSKQINMLSDQQAGRLLKAILEYTSNGVVTEFGDPMIELVFSYIQGHIDRDSQKWEDVRQKRVMAGRKGGKATQANACFAKQSQANQAVNVNDNVNANENDNVTVNETVNDNGDKSVIGSGNADLSDPLPSPEGEASDNAENFERFWSSYPKKVSKQKAFRVWQSISPDKSLTETMIASLERQRKSPDWNTENGRYIPYPARWLSEKRWEDETKVIASDNDSHSFNLEEYKSLVNTFGD